MTIKVDGAQAAQQAIDGVVAAADRLGAAGGRVSGQLGVLKTQAEQASGASRNFGTMIGQAGYQVQDFAVQVASGQSALTAFVQQGSQLAGIFGPTGIIVGAALAVGGIAAQILLGRDATKAWTDALKEQEASLRRVSDEAERWREGMDREATQVRQLTTYYNSLSEARRSVEIREVLRQQTTLNEREAVLRRDLEGGAGALATGVRDQMTQARDYARAAYPSGSAEQRAALDAIDNSDAGRRLNEIVDAYDRFRGSGTLTVEAVAQLSAALRVLGQENDNVGAMARRAADAMERQLPAVRELEGAQRDLTARSQALGVATTGLATGVDAARTSFERLRDVVLANPFRGLDAQIASASERMAALSRGGLALYEGVQSVQNQGERANTLYQSWERARRAELSGPGGLDAEAVNARIIAEGPDALLRAQTASQQSATETFRVGQARDAARRGGGGSRLPDADLQAGWLAVQDQNRDREAAERAEAREWDQEQERREREAERAQERAIQANRRVTDSIVGYTADAFADMFDKNGKGWEGMVDTFETTFKRMIARIAAEAIIRPIVAPIVQSLGLGALGTGNGGFAGFGGLFGGGGDVAAGGGMASAGGGTGGLGQLQSVGSLFSTSTWGGGGGWFSGFGGLLGGSTAPAISSLPAAPTAGSIAGVVPSSGMTIGGASLGAWGAGIGIGYMGGSMLGSYIAQTPAQRTNSQIGAGGGALAGAAIGTAIFPGVGKVIGGALGGIVGGGAGGMIGPSSKFSGGDVGIGVGADGLLRITGTGGKNWNAGAARDSVQQQLDQINAVLRASGTTISGAGGFDWDRGSGGLTLGFAGSGGSSNVFGPSEIFRRVRGNLTSSNDNMRTALQSSTVQSFGDVANVAQWLASTYEPLSKATEQASSWNDALKRINDTFLPAIETASRFGLAIEQLMARQKEATDEFRRAHNLVTTGISTSLEARGLRATGDVEKIAQADRLLFDSAAAQEQVTFEKQLKDLNVNVWNPTQYRQMLDTLGTVQQAERAALLRNQEQMRVSQEQMRVSSGRSLMEELTIGTLGGLSSATRFAAASKNYRDARESGNLDRITAAGRSLATVGRDYLGTSERFGGIVADISRDVRRLGGDPVGLGVFLEGQAASNMTLDRIYSLGNSQLSELKSMRTEIARLNAVITTLMQRQAA